LLRPGICFHTPAKSRERIAIRQHKTGGAS
jgi:hypothetical protein